MFIKKQTTLEKAEEAARIGVELILVDKDSVNRKELHRIIKATFMLGASWGNGKSKNDPLWTNLM